MKQREEELSTEKALIAIEEAKYGKSMFIDNVDDYFGKTMIVNFISMYLSPLNVGFMIHSWMINLDRFT